MIARLKCAGAELAYPQTMSKTDGTKPELRFAVGGHAGQVMQDYFLADAMGAKLSAKFRMYYLLRPLIPIWMRQRMQKSHGGTVADVSQDWYIPTDFINDFQAALAVDLKEDPDLHIIHPWPDQHEMSVSLTHDVETKAGVAYVDQLAKAEESLGFRSCWYFIPYKYSIDKGLIKDLKQRGHSVGVHGYNHDGRLFSSRRVFQKRLTPILKAFEDFQTDGFRAPMVHRNLNWIQEFGAKHDASCFDIDPYQAMAGGVGSCWPFIKGGMVELPYSLPQDHTLFIALGQKDIQPWKRKLEFLKRWRAMAMLVTHPDYLLSNGRRVQYQNFLEHLQTLEDAWFASPSEIADWWLQRDKSTIVENETGNYEIQGPAADRGRCLALSEFSDVSPPA